MRALLITKCKCTREIEVGNRDMRSLIRQGFYVPIFPDTPTSILVEGLSGEFPSVPTVSRRKFMCKGRRTEEGLPILHEVQDD